MSQAKRFIIDRLAFTGPNVPTKDLVFYEGVNVLWGASQAGKSFMIKALDYMSGGGTPLPEIDEIRGYDRCWLEMTLPGPEQITLARAITGSDFTAYSGPVDPSSPGESNRSFAADHKSRDSLSRFLLAELGIGEHSIARTLNGAKSTFTYRHFSPYIYTDETGMMAEWSPIRQSEKSGDTFDRNVLKFILTGLDDSAMVTVPKTDLQRASNAGKLEYIDELLAVLRAKSERDHPGTPDLDDQDAKLATSIGELQRTLAQRQKRLDEIRAERRTKVDAQADAQERQTDILLTVERFDLLAKVYDSDMERLQSLDEGGAALLAGSHRPCPLCGAMPEHQHRTHGLDEVDQARRAVLAEMAKIQLERSDLGKAVASLQAEHQGIVRRLQRIAGEIQALDDELDLNLPLEDTARQQYENLMATRDLVREGIALRDRVAELERSRAQVASFKPKSVPRGSVVAGIDGITGHELATTVQGVLHAWKFPGLPVVSFDDKTHDILLNGKGRRGNGKGVRALMNAAFKIGLFLYCREKELPHPGILVLDSPLLSYRDSLTSRHGALSDDEAEVTKTGLKDEFYKYLLDHKDEAQFIVVENDPPPATLSGMHITTFTGPHGTGGRRGLL